MIKRYPIELALYGHEHSDALYRQGHTVYHRQRPLFQEGFSEIIVTNSTSATLHDQTYNFDLSYVPVVPTEETSSYSFLIVIPAIVVLAMYIRKRKANL